MYCNNSFKIGQIIALTAFALIIGTGILFYTIAFHPAEDRLLMAWTATENDVEVKIHVMKRPSGQLRLSATFVPTRPQFYLYSKDLPKDGLNGLGRPTLLEVIRSDSIKPTGLLEADQPARDIYVETLGLSFPVYPVGPVTLSLPFELVASSKTVSMEVAITYMACSDRTCLPPVINKHMFIQVPAVFFDD